MLKSRELKKLAVCFLIFVVAALYSYAVQSQQPQDMILPCFDRNILENTLKEDFGERKFWRAKDERGQYIEMFANPFTGSFTLTINDRNRNLLCVLVQGSNLRVPEPDGTYIGN